MTGAEFKQLRYDLGDAIGVKIHHADMARICGLAAANGPETIRKWESGDGPSGPVATLLSLLAYASDRHPIPNATSRAGYVVSDTIADCAFQEMMKAEILLRLNQST